MSLMKAVRRPTVTFTRNGSQKRDSISNSNRKQCRVFFTAERLRRVSETVPRLRPAVRGAASDRRICRPASSSGRRDVQPELLPRCHESVERLAINVGQGTDNYSILCWVPPLVSQKMTKLCDKKLQFSGQPIFLSHLSPAITFKTYHCYLLQVQHQNHPSKG